MRGHLQLGTQLMRHPHTHQRGLAILWSTPCAFAASSMSFLLLPHPESEKKHRKLISVNANQNRLQSGLITVNYNHVCTESNQTTGSGPSTSGRCSPPAKLREYCASAELEIIHADQQRAVLGRVQLHL